MKKIELEQKIKDLEAKILALEARPICFGNHCCCNHLHNTPNPVYPGTFPMNPPWCGPIVTCGTTTGDVLPPNSFTIS